MRLLVDVIPFDGGRSGVSQYMLNVVRALAEAGHDLKLVAEPGVAAHYFPGYPALEAPGWTRSPILSMLWHLVALPAKVRATGCDAMLVLAANRRALRYCPIPTVGVVHDLSQYHVPGKYDAFRTFYIKHVLPHFVRKMHRIVAVSKSTAADLERYWRLPARRIAVVYNGFTHPGRSVGGGETSPRSILYISRLEHPGKNHVGLIEAYGMLPRELAERHPLVLAGGEWNGHEAVCAAAETSPYREFIRLPGFVPDSELPRLWAEAAVYVFPSRFEGFGLSLLEAMAAGVPVACSRTSSLGELGEGVAELFDPESAQSMNMAMKKLLTEDNAARIAAGRRRAAGFSWRRCADGIVAAFPRSAVFGVPICVTTMEKALDAVFAAADDAHPRFFAFANAHALNLAYVDANFAEILRQADAVWPDGTGVRLAGRRIGFPVVENVNGTDLFPLLAERAVREGRSLFLFGARPGVAEAAARAIRIAHPGVRIAGTCDGYVSDDEAVARINAARPDIVLVAKGMPLQEKWIVENRDRVRCAALIAVGGLFDFVSGRIPRAPLWMRRAGIEWLYRLKCEPLRMFSRYVIGNPLFLMRLRRVAAAVVACLLLQSCQTSSPYDSIKSWAVCQHSVPVFAAAYDVIYISSQTNDWRLGSNAMLTGTAVRDRTKAFEPDPDGGTLRRARVFAPFVAPERAEEDIRRAIQFYLDRYHDDGRPYVVVAEGLGEATAEALDSLSGAWGSVDSDDGFVGAFIGRAGEEFVMSDVATMTTRLCRDNEYRREWREEAPANTNGLSSAVLEALHDWR